MVLQYNAIVKAIKGASSLAKVEKAATKAVTDTKGAIEKGHEAMFGPLARDFRQEAFDRIEKQAKKAGIEKVKAIKATDDLWLVELLKKLMGAAGKKITLVQGETKEKVLRVLRGPTMKKAIKEGWGVAKMARELQPELAAIDPKLDSRYRVERIARTEVIASSNQSSHEGAKAAADEYGVELEHEWLSTVGDDKTRRPPRDKKNHVAANHQKKPIDKPFIVSGQELMWPGDSSRGATADNTINCRCAVAETIVE